MKLLFRVALKLTRWTRTYHWEPDGHANCVEVRDYWFPGTPFALVLRARTMNPSKAKP